jgi:hypothetical protein
MHRQLVSNSYDVGRTSWTLIHEEAAMATIAFNTALRKAERLEAVLTAVGGKFDVLVSYQLQQATAEAEPARTLANDEQARAATQFKPLDAGVISDAFPAFFIGRNGEGFWVARDAKGRIGGLFLRKVSAISFARTQSGPGVCATIFPTGRFELDLENSGNPLIPCLRPLMRLAQHLQQRAIAGVGQIAAAILRRRKA